METGNGNWKQMGMKDAPITGAMFSWAYGKVGNGNEMETGNGNWKWKPETENRNGNATSSLL